MLTSSICKTRALRNTTRTAIARAARSNFQLTCTAIDQGAPVTLLSHCNGAYMGDTYCGSSPVSFWRPWEQHGGAEQHATATVRQIVELALYKAWSVNPCGWAFA